MSKIDQEEKRALSRLSEIGSLLSSSHSKSKFEKLLQEAFKLLKSILPSELYVLLQSPHASSEKNIPKKENTPKNTRVIEAPLGTLARKISERESIKIRGPRPILGPMREVRVPKLPRK